MGHGCIISFVMVWVSRHGTDTIQWLRLWASPK